MIKRHCLLVIFGFVYAQCFFYLSINLVYTLYFSGPLFVLGIDYYINGITITKRQGIGIIFACLGVILAVNGGIIYSIFDPNYEFHSTFQHFKTEASNIYIQLVVCIILILAIAGWAYSIVLVKAIKNATHYQMNLQYGAMMIMFAGCVYPNTVVEETVRLKSFLLSLLLQGLPLAIAQALFSHSMIITKKLGVMTMNGFLCVVISYLLKIFRYHQTINWICLLGTILILCGIYRIVIKSSSLPQE